MDFGLVEKMQVAMYIGLFDDTCPLVNAMESVQQMGHATATHVVVAPWQGHVPWGFSSAPWFMEDMIETL